MTCPIADSPVTVTLNTFSYMCRRCNTSTTVSLLNRYMKAPSNAEKEFILPILNSGIDPCSTAPRYTFNQRDNIWEYI